MKRLGFFIEVLAEDDDDGFGLEQVIHDFLEYVNLGGNTEVDLVRFTGEVVIP